MNRREAKARALFLEGFNCAQSVFAAFDDELQLDRQTALRLAASFGAGMGRLREVCGAVSGMFLVVGALRGYDDPTDATAKAAHYQLVQELAKEFSDANGSIVCRELLGLAAKTNSPTPEPRSKDYYRKRPCLDLVGDAARIVDKRLEVLKLIEQSKK